YRNGYLLGFHGGAYRWESEELFVNGGGGNVNGWASDGNESGYVSKPGYVRDVEFGYGDEEDDARFLSLGERMRVINGERGLSRVDIKYSFTAEKKEKKGSSTMRIVEIEEPPSNQRAVVLSQCQKETYIMNLRENVTYDCERELAEERYGEDDKAL
ncbi:Adhesion G-protein coupled receptor D1, partial [Bienertia sinuspersici]